MPASNAPPTDRVASTTIPISPEVRDHLRVRCAEEGGLSYDQYIETLLELEDE